MKWPVFTYNLIIFSFFFGGGEILAQDVTPPEKPVLTYVTVDTANNNVNIFWKKSPSPDVVRYILYKEVMTPNGYEGVELDSVPATENSYTHITSGLAGREPLLYSICAVDMAGNKSTRTGVHSTIHTSVTYDSCLSTLTLRWTKYQGWGNNVSGYRVHARQGSGSYQIITGIDSKDSTYIIYEVPENTQFYFFIEGVTTGDTYISMSNIAAKYTYMPLPPDDLLLNYVTVTGSNTVDLKFSFTGITLIDDFALLRSSLDSTEFDPVKIFHNVNSSPQTIQDSILTSVNKYFYRIGALNTCGVVIDTTNLGTNILLLGRNEGEFNFLEWNIYRDFPPGTETYEIYRLDNAGDLKLLSTVNGQNTYTDDLSAIYGQHFSGKIIYQVKAVEKGALNDANSNFYEINVNSKTWMPNAFTPNGDGKNDVFAPYFYFIPDDYLMLIYDRYGIAIFTSKNPEIGWDGRINGNNFAPEGVYIYHVQFSSFNGQNVNETGYVSVFYPR